MVRHSAVVRLLAATWPYLLVDTAIVAGALTGLLRDCHMDLLVAMALVQRALSERQQVVVPLAIRISTDVRSLARLTDHADIGALPTYGIQNKKRVGLGLDAFDYLFPRPAPLAAITQVGNVLVGTLRIGLRDAGYLCVWHGKSFLLPWPGA